MGDITAALAAHRAAVDEFANTAAKAAGNWTTPRAPGKWSPSQVAEHVARAIEESANEVRGEPSRFPSVPAFVRPVVRGVFFNRVLKKGAFPRAKTNRALDPESGPESPTAARTRLDRAVGTFEEACRAASGRSETMTTTLFGKVELADYVRFQELHARHHEKQLG
ncbi:MAG TPA: DinB family protein [Gemmatimonadales bacterium]